MPEGVKSAVSSVARTINRVLHMIGTESPKADKQPIEDASVDWPADISPYQTDATISIPAQDA